MYQVSMSYVLWLRLVLEQQRFLRNTGTVATSTT